MGVGAVAERHVPTVNTPKPEKPGDRRRNSSLAEAVVNVRVFFFLLIMSVLLRLLIHPHPLNLLPLHDVKSSAARGHDKTRFLNKQL